MLFWMALNKTHQYMHLLSHLGSLLGSLVVSYPKLKGSSSLYVLYCKTLEEEIKEGHVLSRAHVNICPID